MQMGLLWSRYNMHAVQAVSVGKEGQPQGKVVPEKAQKRDKDRRRKTASASCSEEQMPREQLLLTFTDGDRGRADISRHKESRRRGRKGQPWKEASFRCGRDTERGRSRCWRQQRRRAKGKGRGSSEELWGVCTVHDETGKPWGSRTWGKQGHSWRLLREAAWEGCYRTGTLTLP